MLAAWLSIFTDTAALLQNRRFLNIMVPCAHPLGVVS